MDQTDPTKLSSPNIFLVRMVIFLTITAFVAFFLYRQVAVAFRGNPFLNGLILSVLAIGILLAIIQVARLYREVRWANGYRAGAHTLAVERGPVLLAPMAALLGDRIGQMQIGPAVLRSILDSVGSRLDEDRDISRYLTGLLVFLGLLGTFWGLTETVSSIGRTIAALDVKASDLNTMFESLKSGLAAPLSGMGTAFSASLFGLSGSLILGFLDLQAGQAQNRFYQELEDWLSTMTEVSSEAPIAPIAVNAAPTDIQNALDRLTRAVNDGASSRSATAAMANLAEGIQGLVQHMRNEQQLIRDWVEAQSAQQKDTRRLLEKLSQHLSEKEM